jgi:xylose isomerase
MALFSTKQQKQRKSPEQMLKHLQSFELELKFTAGVWFFYPGGGRFHDQYIDKPKTRDEWLKGVFDYAAPLKKYGLVGLEAHYPTRWTRRTSSSTKNSHATRASGSSQ